MEQDIVLQVKNLSVAFGNEIALRDISFEVARNEVLAIIGPNGAGKTVLFRALLGLVPYQGSIQWQSGIHIGYVPQKFSIDRESPLTVEEFFLLETQHFWYPEKQIREHLNHELILVGLESGILKKPIAALSGGQLQRALVARAMLNHPDILLFDEPTAGIDVGGEETIYHLIHKMQDERGITVILISHDLNIIYKYTQKVLCINKELKCHGAPFDILKPEELTKLYGENALYHHMEQELA